MAWTTWGNAPWFGETTIVHTGALWAAQSGFIGDSQDSWLQAAVTGPGLLTYWWKVSSETNFDFVQFYTNGVLQSNFISGEVDWTQQTFTLPDGPQTVAWRYVKDSDNTIGLDAGWLSEVTFTPPVPWLQLVPTNNQMKITVHGMVGHTLLIQYSTNLASWTTLTNLTLTTNTIIIYDPTPLSAGARFYRVRDLSVSMLHLDPPLPTNGSVMLVLHSPPNLQFNLQTSSNLARLSSLGIVTNTSGTLMYPTARLTNSPRQFYRALLLACIPTLGASGVRVLWPARIWRKRRKK
jgi:hypothetical protein